MSELLTGSRYAACIPVALANAAGYWVDAGCDPFVNAVADLRDLDLLGDT